MIIPFYRHLTPDHRGRTLRNIRSFNHNELEQRHDFIQWLFPLPEPSSALRQAPILTATDIAAFRDNPPLRAELLESLRLMLDFYGFTLVNGPKVERAATFPARSTNWLTPHNHNFLRLTRIIRSLTLLGLEPEARALLDALEAVAAVAADHPDIVGAETIGYWRRAVHES